jgi:hypothetical protein
MLLKSASHAITIAVVAVAAIVAITTAGKNQIS